MTTMSQALRARALAKSAPPSPGMQATGQVLTTDPLAPGVTVYTNQQTGAQDPGTGGPAVAWRVFYDNALSGMQADNVQDAIDQLDNRLSTLVTFKGVKEIIDPAYVIGSTDIGFLLKWRGAGKATWQLPATLAVNAEMLCLRAGSGDLTFVPQAGATLACGLDSSAGNHNGVAYPKGYVHLLVDQNAGGNAAAWILAGATAVVP